MKNEKTYSIGKKVRARVIESKSIDLLMDSYFQHVRVQLDDGAVFSAALECDRDGNPVVATGAVFDAEIGFSAFATTPFTENSCLMFERINHISGPGLFDHLKNCLHGMRFED